MGQYFYCLLFLPLIAASICLFVRDKTKVESFVSLVFSLAYASFSIWLLLSSQSGDSVIVGNWPTGIGIKLKLDLFSNIMTSVVGLIYVTGSLFSVRGRTTESNSNFNFLYHTLFLGLTGAFLTQDLFNLFVWFEITLMSSYVLVVLDHSKDRLRAGLRYILLNFLSGLVFLISVGLIYNVTKTLDFSVLHERLGEVYLTEPGLVRALGLILFGAFAIKSAFFPLFFWLPESYPRLSPGLSGVLAGLLTKLGLYAMMRVFGEVFPADIKFFWIILVLSILTLLIGVWGAVVQNHLRKILSYHIISQVGFIGVGVSFCMHPNTIFKQIGMASALFYIVHHIVVKTNLFFVSGLVLDKTKTEDLRSLGGLFTSSPFLALLFLVPAGSLIGIPPLSGFWAKLELFKLAIESRILWIILPMLVGSFFTLYSMVKIWSEAFWGNTNKSGFDINHSFLPRSYTACFILGVITLLISLSPSWIIQLAKEVGRQGANF